MLENDIVTATKQTVTSTSDSRQYDGSKGKRGCDNQDMRGKRDSSDSRRISRNDETDPSGYRATNKREHRPDKVHCPTFSTLSNHSVISGLRVA